MPYGNEELSKCMLHCWVYRVRKYCWLLNLFVLDSVLIYWCFCLMALISLVSGCYLPGLPSRFSFHSAWSTTARRSSGSSRCYDGTRYWYTGRRSCRLSRRPSNAPAARNSLCKVSLLFFCSLINSSSITVVHKTLYKTKSWLYSQYYGIRFLVATLNPRCYPCAKCFGITSIGSKMRKLVW